MSGGEAYRTLKSCARGKLCLGEPESKICIRRLIVTLDRDEALDVIQTVVLQRGIYFRGRFGAWKYAVGNMVHSLQKGLEAVNTILFQREETAIQGS